MKTMHAQQFVIDSEQELERLGACFSALSGEQALLTMEGGLGAGKTTFVRGLLHAAGYQGAVKSPTFSLVEPYEVRTGRVLHFDLYRLKEPEELEYVGIRDYLHQPALCIVEWPEKAGDLLPEGDIHIIIDKTGQGRTVRLQINTERGQILYRKLSLVDCWTKGKSRNTPAV